jgi:type III pantothenate kinase
MNKHTYVLDAGNTSVKVGLFENGVLKNVLRVPTSDKSRRNEIKELIPRNSTLVLCSVACEEFNVFVHSLSTNLTVINANSPLPIRNAYHSPESLGMDRLCNAVAIHSFKKSSNAVAIDIGTCMKFDLVEGDEYIGGSISPGIDLRYKALHDFTAKLPLINSHSQDSFIGKNTVTSMTAGVIQGLDAEIKGMMDKYRSAFGQDLTFFMTGGDVDCFDFEGKNDIFADPNLTLKGVYEIYLCHVEC